DRGDIDEQLLCSRAPCGGVPKMYQGVDGEERRTNLRGRSSRRLHREPHERHSADEVGGADVANEMSIKRAGVDDARHVRVPETRTGKHDQAIGHQAQSQEPAEQPRDGGCHRSPRLQTRNWPTAITNDTTSPIAQSVQATRSATAARML